MGKEEDCWGLRFVCPCVPAPVRSSGPNELELAGQRYRGDRRRATHTAALSSNSSLKTASAHACVAPAPIPPVPPPTWSSSSVNAPEPRLRSDTP